MVDGGGKIPSLFKIRQGVAGEGEFQYFVAIAGFVSRAA